MDKIMFRMYDTTWKEYGYRETCDGDIIELESYKLSISMAIYTTWGNMIFELASPYVAAASYRGTDTIARTIFEGDVVRLNVDGESRTFEVKFGKVDRLMTNDDGPDNWVEICGFYFHWIAEEMDLFPMWGENGTMDYEKMEILGTIHDKEYNNDK